MNEWFERDWIGIAQVFLIQKTIKEKGEERRERSYGITSVPRKLVSSITGTGQNWQNAISLLEEIAHDIPKLPTFESTDRGTSTPILRGEQEIVGPALRVFQSYLETVDPQRVWGELHKTITPDGHILWLCASHRQQYEAKPLQLYP